MHRIGRSMGDESAPMMIRPNSTALAVACMLLSACASVKQSPLNADQARQIGWLHGNCLALEKQAPAGAEVVIVALDDPQRMIPARITGTAVEADTCLPLLEDRRGANLARGLSFYRVEAAAPIGLAIGIVQHRGDPSGADQVLDTNNDGRRDVFSHCAATEGVRFTIWPREAHRGEPLWTGYYYLGYDTEADCPDGS